MPEEPRDTGEPLEWSRRQFLGGVGVMVGAGLVATFGRSAIVDAARAVFGSPVSTGTTYLYALDYYFVPNYMTWKVGDKITIAFRNRSQSHPGKLHEWMCGRHVNMIATPLGDETGNGFHQALFNGVDVWLSHAHLVHDLAIGGARVHFTGPKPPNIHVGRADALSPTLYPGGAIDLSFQVPDKPGLWQYGCFVQHDIHYRVGMRGLINIVRA
ncbi:MAG: twin-arginine translocation signal domain-containing protein [Thermaerobacter sp.]|nr:twin-arginine translocation signal domain-containing protein [Thermaerobacter sp.]